MKTYEQELENLQDIKISDLDELYKKINELIPKYQSEIKEIPKEEEETNDKEV